MGTFSPRIVRQILQDRPSQSAIGLFAGTFTFSLLSMRAVHTTSAGGTVPGLAVVFAIALVMCCIGTLVWCVNHIAQSLRTAALVEWVAGDTITALDRVYPDHGSWASAHGRRRGPAIGRRRLAADVRARTPLAVLARSPGTFASHADRRLIKEERCSGESWNF